MSNQNISRLSVAELKQLVARPDVVEMHDVTARDPRLEFRPSLDENSHQVAGTPQVDSQHGASAKTLVLQKKIPSGVAHIDILLQ